MLNLKSWEDWKRFSLRTLRLFFSICLSLHLVPVAENNYHSMMLWPLCGHWTVNKRTKLLGLKDEGSLEVF